MISALYPDLSAIRLSGILKPNKMKTTPTVRKAILWTARISSLAILAFFYFFIGAHVVEAIQGAEPPHPIPLQEKAMMLSGVLGILGLTLAFFKERIGSVISLIGMVAFFAIAPYLLLNFYFVMLLIPGLLFFAHSFIKEQNLA